jgi:DNA-directed RNA polymerase subunit RPC12/RpoP
LSDKLDHDEKSDDIDVKMYAPFSCVDCGQEFESREELEEHETKHEILSEKRETTEN